MNRISFLNRGYAFKGLLAVLPNDIVNFEQRAPGFSFPLVFIFSYA